MAVTRSPAASPVTSRPENPDVEVSPAGRVPRSLLRCAPLSVVLILAPALVGAVRLLAGIGRPFDLVGDHAILEAAVRRVSSGTQTLGPYSRFGFHQPGPAYFFCQAPFSWLTGGSARSLFLGALALNLGCAAGAVLVVRRWLGEAAARRAALVIAAYLVVLGPGLLADPWNPYVLGLPLLLTLVLGAAARKHSTQP